MSKISYDVTDVQSGGQDFDVPIPRGVYRVKIDSIDEGTSQSSGNPMLTVVLKLTRGEYKGRQLWDYIVLTESSAWKLRSFLEAVGHIGKNGAKAKGTFDPQDYVGRMLQVRVKHETDDRPETLEANDGKPVVRSRVGALLPLPDDAEPEDDEDELDAEEPEDDDESEPEMTYDDVMSMGKRDLKATITDYELDVRVTKQSKLETLRERVAEELGLEPSEDEGSDDDDEETYDDWSVADLKAELKERGLGAGGPKSKLVARLEADDEEDADDDGEPF